MLSRRLALAAMLLAFLAPVLVTACGDGSGSEATAGSGASAQGAYYCPMHPSYRSDRPGDCPICNMKLVQAEDEPAATAHGATAHGATEHGGMPDHATATIPAGLQRRIGLTTTVVERRPFSRTIRAAARVEIDERGLAAVSLRYGGWIEELHVRATGDLVGAGDPLLAIYSPELYEAQRSYRVARASLPAADEAVASARERLRLLEMSEEQIDDLEQGGDPGPRTLVLSKVTGVITRREAVLGMRVEPGETLFEIADLRTVWVIADVYEDEISLVRLGAEAAIELASAPGESFAGRVTFVYPTLAESTRTARVRIEVPNPDGSIRPGTYATVRIPSDLGEQTLVDVDSVLDTGTRQIAFVEAEAGVFEPREVRLGPRSDGVAVVLSGLEPGERVAAKATFLVDSESRLKAAIRGHGSHEGH